MQKDDEIDLACRKFTSRLIIERAMARGWHVTGFDSNNAIYLIEIPGREIPIKIFSASPPQMSYPAVKVANDKFISSQILNNYGLPVPEDCLVNTDKPLDFDKLQNFLGKHGKLVVKPLDASHGKGITVDISDLDRLKSSLLEAKKYTQKDNVLVQQQVAGEDVRLICIDYVFKAAITRIPAEVVGDGLHTISELIENENNSDKRGENYKTRINNINKARALDYLGLQKMQSIPKINEIVRVIGVANIGMGGERKVITENIPEFLIEIAEKSAKILELPVCAVDFMTAVVPKKDINQAILKPYLIELNGCPQLLISDNPYSEEQSDFIDSYLDFVAKY